MKHAREFAWDGLHVFVLVGFAVAQPLFAVLCKGPAFFVTRRSEPGDIVALAAILCFGLPAAIVFVEFLIGLVNHTARKCVHFVIVAVLLALFALPVLKNLDRIPGIACVIGAAVLGLVAAAAYYRFNPVRAFATVLSPAILVFPLLFLCRGPVSEIVWSQSGVEGSSCSNRSVTIRRPAPVVFIVLDEFPTVSLMDERRQIDPVRYPNFAAFAREATWFRNMTTNSPATVMAVPTLLTGKYPTGPIDPSLPTLGDHPINLFTLLEESYDVYGFEISTDLCPTEPDDVLATATVSTMASDLWVVYRHIAVPRSLLREGFPDITAKWADFQGRDPVRTRGSNKKYGRLGHYRQVFSTFRPTSRPPLYFAHLMLPHTPFIYLPSGEQYAKGDGRLAATVQPIRFSGVWVEDEKMVAREYQRHLLQVGCTDTLVGELMAHLKQVGLYDDALIVLVADHGVCHRPGQWRRNLSEETLGDVMPVPLLIKAPRQKVGGISDRNVESIDVLPTIAGILGMDLPCPVDGSDALDPLVPERPRKVIYQFGPALYPKTRVAGGRFIVDAAFQQMYAALDRKLRLFGSGRNPNGLYQLEPQGNWGQGQLGQLGAGRE